MGINSIGLLSKLVAAYLDKKGMCIGHSFHRSGVTALAEAEDYGNTQYQEFVDSKYRLYTYHVDLIK